MTEILRMNERPAPGDAQLENDREIIVRDASGGWKGRPIGSRHFMISYGGEAIGIVLEPDQLKLLKEEGL